MTDDPVLSDPVYGENEAPFHVENVLQYLHEINHYPLLSQKEAFHLSVCIQAERYLNTLLEDEEEQTAANIHEAFLHQWETFEEGISAYNAAKTDSVTVPDFPDLVQEADRLSEDGHALGADTVYIFMYQHSLSQDHLWQAVCSHLFDAFLCIYLLPKGIRDDSLQNSIAVDEREMKRRIRQIRERAAAANHEFINANLRLVYNIAKHYQDRGASIDDLTQEGNIGLFHAVEKYDPRLGYRFSSYASWWIRQSIVRSLAEQERLIRVPAHTFETVMKIKRIRRDLEKENGEEPSMEDLAAAAGMMSRKDCAEWQKCRADGKIPTGNLLERGRAAGKNVRELLQMVDDPLSLEDPERDEQYMLRPEDEVDRAILEEQLRKAMNQLKEREIFILERRFGIMGQEKMTLEEISKECGISKERVRQIADYAIERLRKPLSDYHIEDFS